jgi:choline dehydrogenase-like flavoprotein
VLGRFICSTYDEATTNPDFDVVVIGSGMYGSYAAAKIYSESAKSGRTPLRVLVLEAGRFSSKSTDITSPTSGSATRSAR